MQPTDLLQSLGNAELYEGSFDSLEVGFISGEVKSAMSREASGLGVRAQKDGRMGFVSSRDTSQNGLDRLAVHVENALEVGDPATFEFPTPTDPPVDPKTLELWNDETKALTTGDLVSLGEQAVGQLRERFPKVIFNATLRRSVGHTHLRNSKGVSIEDRYTVFSFSVEANRTSEADVLMDYAYVRGISTGDAPTQRVVDELSQRLTWAEETVTAKPGRMPVLFTPAGGMVVWSPLLQALNGKTVMLGTSPLRDRVGDTVLDPRVQVTDDGLLPGALGSAPFDDEGTPRQTRALIEDGVLRGFVHDLDTAKATGQEPTGNGERGGSTSRPGPGFSNLLVRGGEKSWKELLKGIEYGILVHSVMGQGQGNTLPGTFSNPIDLGFLIEKGEVKGRIRNLSIAGNIYELLKDQLTGLSSEVVRLGGGTFLPWLLLDDMNVVGQSQA